MGVDSLDCTLPLYLFLPMTNQREWPAPLLVSLCNMEKLHFSFSFFKADASLPAPIFGKFVQISFLPCLPVTSSSSM